ncbi:MAG: hypothetical protein JWN23_3281 [Rhodocyclales bacterium]|nr:hypothetical protein [Rhodocyclales bacterium]
MTANKRQMPTDPDFVGAQQAIKRAAQRAREVAEATNTPCYVMQDGKIIDIARKPVSPAKK